MVAQKNASNVVRNRLISHQEKVIRLTELQRALYTVRAKKNRQALLNFFNLNNTNKFSILNNAGATLTHKNVSNVKKGKKKIPVFSSGNTGIFLLNANYLRNHTPNSKSTKPYSFGNGDIFVNPIKAGSSKKTAAAPKNSNGCVKQTTKKYTSRKSPPYPANKCCGKEMVGSNNLMYISKATKAGSCRWIKKK